MLTPVLPFLRTNPSAFFDPLPILSFDVIMADPPWLFALRSEAGAGKAPQGQYRCLPTAEIAAMPVGYLGRGDCWLWLWATFPMIQDAFQVMAAWGFRYVTGGSWIKRGGSGKLAFGPGYVLRGNAELFLIGRFGNPKTHCRSTRNVIEAPLRRHSEKPEEAYAVAESLFGPGRRADLFSRKTRPSWEAWGHEAGKFDEIGGKASSALASETRGGTGDDCSVGKRGAWPPLAGASSSLEPTAALNVVTAGETATLFSGRRE